MTDQVDKCIEERFVLDVAVEYDGERARALERSNIKALEQNKPVNLVWLYKKTKQMRLVEHSLIERFQLQSLPSPSQQSRFTVHLLLLMKIIIDTLNNRTWFLS